MKFHTQKEAHAYLRSLPKPRPYIHPTAVIDKCVIAGKDITIGAHSVIGKEGFGFDPETAYSQRWPHEGNVILGNNVEIGANCCIDRAVFGSTLIMEDTKLDNLIHIAHNCQIGKNNLLCAGVIVGGSVTMGDNCFVGLNATIKDHVTIGNNVVIGCGANVVRDVPDGLTVKGNPAK